MPIEHYREVILFLLVNISAINDLMTRRIPNRLLLAGLVCALALRLMSGTPLASLLAGFGGLGVGLAMFLPFYLMRGMAAGDVKLMAVVGAFSGPTYALEIAVLSWCAGGVMALFLIVLRGRLRLALVNIAHMMAGLLTPGATVVGPSHEQSAGSMPYGLAIAVGTITVLARHYG